jgi:antitoxin component YwqK of YwqJK toxin-antitoxin module
LLVYKHINSANNNKGLFKIFYILLFFVNTVNSQDSIYKKFLFENLKISSEGYLVNNIPAGKWISYHKNNHVKSEGFWKDSKLDSLWTFYDTLGNIILREKYSKNLKNGKSIEYDIKGNITRETNYKSGEKNGLERLFKKNTNQILLTNTYMNDKKNGTSLEYDTNQKVITILNYDKGVLASKEEINRYDMEGEKQGVWKDFYKNGNVKKENIFFHGKKNGYERKYNEKGKVEELQNYNKGKINNTDLSLELDLSKVKLDSDKYMMGKVDNQSKKGLFKVYNNQDSLIGVRFYQNDTLTSKGKYNNFNKKIGKWIYYWENQQIKKEGLFEINNKKGEWKYYFKNGYLQQKGVYVKNKPNGLWEWWYENGVKRRTEEYLNGRENGEVKEYDTLGNLITHGEYSYGEREGDWFYIINDYKEEGKFTGGMKTGKWKTTYINKKQIKFQGEYINDTPIGKHTFYFPNGLIKKVGKYKNGLKNGEWILYNERGEKKISYLYKRGIEIKRDGIKIRK